MYPDNLQHIALLQERIHQVLKAHVPAHGRFALVDFPDYANVGDSAIWLGEIAYFINWHHISPSYVCSAHIPSIAEMESQSADEPIFLSGGGNFGDLWPEIQEFREEIIRRFPKRKIIQLPQSLHFSDASSAARCAAIINAHADFTLLVRDQASFEFAQQYFTCPVVLTPDMALCLGDIRRLDRISRPLLLLMRTDKEKSTGDIPEHLLPRGAIVEDWNDEPDDTRRLARLSAILRLPLLGLGVFSAGKRREMRYRMVARRRLVRGLKQLSSAKIVITDRLHAHILCLLLGVPQIVLDNSYGKISRFAALWTKEFRGVDHAGTIESALDHYHATTV